MDHLLHPLGVGSGRGQHNSVLLLSAQGFLFMSVQRFIDSCSNTSCNKLLHCITFFLWGGGGAGFSVNKSARVLLAASDVEQRSKERQGQFIKCRSGGKRQPQLGGATYVSVWF